VEASASSAVANVSEHRVLVILYLLTTDETDPLLSPFSWVVSNTRAPDGPIVSETGRLPCYRSGRQQRLVGSAPSIQNNSGLSEDLPAILLQGQEVVKRGREAVP
jgi:hypothetical protein